MTAVGVVNVLLVVLAVLVIGYLIAVLLAPERF